MARPRRGKSRAESDDFMQEYLATGEYPADPDHQVAIQMLGAADLWAQWDQHRAEIMRSWDAPGCRPWAWWRFDAPRLPVGTFAGCFFDGVLPEPRRFIGGSGRPIHRQQAYVPASSFGLWAWYGGTEADPPQFESQFAYLARHGLLLPGEVEGPELQPLPLRWYIPR